MELDEFETLLLEAATALHPRLVAAAHTIVDIDLAKVRSIIGVKQDEWDELAEDTIADKIRLGYSVADGGAPLLREGDLRASYAGAVVDQDVEILAIVGSDDPVALYQELGTSTIPARPVQALAMVEITPQALELLQYIRATMFESIM